MRSVDARTEDPVEATMTAVARTLRQAADVAPADASPIRIVAGRVGSQTTRAAARLAYATTYSIIYGVVVVTMPVAALLSKGRDRVRPPRRARLPARASIKAGTAPGP